MRTLADNAGPPAPAGPVRVAVASFVLGALALAGYLVGHALADRGFSQFRTAAGDAWANAARYGLMLLWYGVLSSLLAILLGHWSRRRIRNTAAGYGEGWARAGYLLGYAVWAFFLFLWPMGGLHWPPRNATPQDRILYDLKVLELQLDKMRGQTGSYPASQQEFERKLAEAFRSQGYRLEVSRPDDYRVEYLPAARDTDGRITSYALRATVLESGGAVHANFFADSAGAVHWTRENRPATASDPGLLRLAEMRFR